MSVPKHCINWAWGCRQNSGGTSRRIQSSKSFLATSQLRHQIKNMNKNKNFAEPNFYTQKKWLIMKCCAWRVCLIPTIPYYATVNDWMTNLANMHLFSPKKGSLSLSGILPEAKAYKAQWPQAGTEHYPWKPMSPNPTAHHKASFSLKASLFKHTSSKISLFLCSSSGSSFISWSTVWMPPCSTTDVDLVSIDWGTVSPDTSSIAAGRLREANTLQNRKQAVSCSSLHCL